MSSTPKSPSLPKLVTVRSSASVKSLSPRSPVIETSKVVETNDDFETSGRQLNQYQISHTIGGGAFGVVYEAVDLTSNEHVVGLGHSLARQFTHFNLCTGYQGDLKESTAQKDPRT